MSGFLNQLVLFLAGVPAEVATVILAMVPVGELRGALPVALLVYDMPVAKAVFLSLFGNLIPVYFLLVFFERVAKWAERHSPLLNRLLQGLYERTRNKLGGKVAKYGPWALALFVGIPLPVTGAWTGALAAFVFGLPRKQAFLAIAVGLVLSAAIVTVLTLGTSVTVNSLFAP